MAAVPRRDRASLYPFCTDGYAALVLTMDLNPRGGDPPRSGGVVAAGRSGGPQPDYALKRFPRRRATVSDVAVRRGGQHLCAHRRWLGGHTPTRLRLVRVRPPSPTAGDVAGVRSRPARRRWRWATRGARVVVAALKPRGGGRLVCLLRTIRRAGHVPRGSGRATVGLVVSTLPPAAASRRALLADSADFRRGLLDVVYATGLTVGAGCARSGAVVFVPGWRGSSPAAMANLNLTTRQGEAMADRAPPMVADGLGCRHVLLLVALLGRPSSSPRHGRESPPRIPIQRRFYARDSAIWWVAPLLAALALVVAFSVGDTAANSALPAYLLFAWLTVCLVWIDLDVHRLPVGLTRPALPAFVVLLLPPTIATGEGGRLLTAVGCGVVLTACYLVVAFLPGGGFGGGDIQLAPTIGLLLGGSRWVTS